MPPSIAESARTPNAFATSPGLVQPPSAMGVSTKTMEHGHIPRPMVGISTPVLILVVQTLPDPIPTLTMSAPFSNSSSVMSAVTTLPAIITMLGYFSLKRAT